MFHAKNFQFHVVQSHAPEPVPVPPKRLDGTDPHGTHEFLDFLTQARRRFFRAAAASSTSIRSASPGLFVVIP